MSALVRRVFTFLVLLLAFGLGVEILLWAVLYETSEYSWFLRYVVIGLDSLSSTGRFSLGALLILLPILIFALEVRAVRRPPILQAKARDGDPINISEPAVRRCLAHQIRAIPEVAGVTSRATNGAKGPRVVLRTLIWAGADVPAVRRLVRQETVRTLRQLFGVAEIEQVHVIVDGLVFRTARGKIRRLRRGRPAPTPDAPESESQE